MYIETSVVVMLMLSAFFSGSETAVMAVDRYQLRTMAKEGHQRAKLLQQFIDDPDRFFSVVLLGNTFANIAAASLFTIWFIATFNEQVLFVGTFSLSLLVLLCCEMLPKSMAARYSLSLGLIVVKPLMIFEVILSPLLYLMRLIFRGKNTKDKTLDGNALRRVIRAASEQLSQEEQEMLQGILDLGDLSVEDVMRPQHLIDVIDYTQPIEKITNQVRASSRPYWVVTNGDGWENIMGVVHLNEFLIKGVQDQQQLRKVMRSANYVQEGTSLKNQLSNFKRKQQEVSIIVDEYGEVQGLLDIHDILEEIIGYYANRPAVPLGAVRFDGDSGYWVKGDVRIRDLNRYLDWDIPAEQGMTVSGLILSEIGIFPDGSCSIVVGRYCLEVVDIKRNLLTLCHIMVQ